MMYSTQQLDRRVKPSPQRHPLIVQRFDGLTAGDLFELINNQQVWPLFDLLQLERRGLFHWAYSGQKPMVWSVNITTVT